MTDPGTLHADARACLDAALAAVEPEQLVAGFLDAHLRELTEVEGKLLLVGFGKGAAAMARGAHRVLGDRVSDGVLVVPGGQEEGVPASLRTFVGGHPIPDAGSVEGAEAVHRIAEGARKGDLLLCLISGGGSALVTLPPLGVTLREVQSTTQALLMAGATIPEINCVRKHLDQLKGGRLARLAAPARVLGLVLSDVVGDPLDVVASGPLNPDHTTYQDAITLLQEHELWDEVPGAVREHLLRGQQGKEEESPGPEHPCFWECSTHLVGCNTMAVEAARNEALSRGYHTAVLSTMITGEAREVGRVLAAVGLEAQRSGNPVPVPACLIAGGETTVHVRGSGRGGRNQELVLGAALALDGERSVLVASMGTDGVDGTTDAAGAVATGQTVARGRALGLSAVTALAHNDVYPFLAALEDLIVTGPTGTNVMDLQLVMVGMAPGQTS